MNPNQLRICFVGRDIPRSAFIKRARMMVIEFVGAPVNTFDAMIIEMVKNIYDYAEGKGSLSIDRDGNTFTFELKDEGKKVYDFEFCSHHSVLAGNGTNFGIGLKMIKDIAQHLAIDLNIDTSQGFRYSGVFVLNS